MSIFHLFIIVCKILTMVCLIYIHLSFPSLKLQILVYTRRVYKIVPLDFDSVGTIWRYNTYLEKAKLLLNKIYAKYFHISRIIKFVSNLSNLLLAIHWIEYFMAYFQRGRGRKYFSFNLFIEILTRH